MRPGSQAHPCAADKPAASGYGRDWNGGSCMGRKHRGSTFDALAALPWPLALVVGLVGYLTVRYGIAWWLSQHGGLLAQGFAQQSDALFAPPGLDVARRLLARRAGLLPRRAPPPPLPRHPYHSGKPGSRRLAPVRTIGRRRLPPPGLPRRRVIPPPISRRQKWNFLVPFPEEVP
ncbi:hypothetical protein XAP6984_650008 [Xanthomonas phaseoli pv. phaseoli]|uniref:Uncharacterized protein n=1 Tax=Xanthomonas campestris pv. phaseoli TaxID=317013 RepID=A0ABY1TVM5_XANCH|nr:hypothetical protein XAP6984_650008 [Xanthomonas phaseoli pv. phaseoli]